MFVIFSLYSTSKVPAVVGLGRRPFREFRAKWAPFLSSRAQGVFTRSYVNISTAFSFELILIIHLALGMNFKLAFINIMMFCQVDFLTVRRQFVYKLSKRLV